MLPEPYASMSSALSGDGIAETALLLDRNRLDDNLATLKARGLPQQIRLVVKSDNPWMSDSLVILKAISVSISNSQMNPMINSQ